METPPLPRNHISLDSTGSEVISSFRPQAPEAPIAAPETSPPVEPSPAPETANAAPDAVDTANVAPDPAPAAEVTQVVPVVGGSEAKTTGSAGAEINDLRRTVNELALSVSALVMALSPQRKTPATSKSRAPLAPGQVGTMVYRASASVATPDKRTVLPPMARRLRADGSAERVHVAAAADSGVHDVASDRGRFQPAKPGGKASAAENSQRRRAEWVGQEAARRDQRLFEGRRDAPTKAARRAREEAQKARDEANPPSKLRRAVRGAGRAAKAVGRGLAYGYTEFIEPAPLDRRGRYVPRPGRVAKGMRRLGFNPRERGAPYT